MLKTAGIEMTKVSDSGSGKKIYVSTTARLAFRKAWPKKAKVRNHILNDFIANMFAGGSESGKFTPKTGGGEGRVREVRGGRFIAIEADDSIKVIAVKGSVPDLPELPESYTPPSLNGTSLSDNTAPEKAAPAPAPTQMELGLSGPSQPKHHTVPSFPESTTPAAPVTPPAPPAPQALPVPQAPPMPATPVPPVAPSSPATSEPSVSPTQQEQEQEQAGLWQRLKQFIGLQR